jgi:hypothetical protein
VTTRVGAMRGSAVAAHASDLGLLPHFDDLAALQVCRQAVHEAGSKNGMAPELGGERSQEIIPSQRMDRPRRPQIGGIFVIGER